MMKDAIRLLALAGMVGFAVPAMAQDASTMTCADYMAMDAEGQQEAMAMMQADASAAGGTATAGTDTTASADSDAMMEEQMASMTAACEADPSMMAMDAMNADG